MSELTNPLTSIPQQDDGSRSVGGDSEPMGEARMAERFEQMYQAAYEIFRNSSDWTDYYARVFGVHGIIRESFSDSKELAAFEKSSAHTEILQLLAKLREQAPASGSPSNRDEPMRIVTIRLPKCLHESLKHEAFERHTSMNQLCISKLLQVVDQAWIPKQE